MASNYGAGVYSPLAPAGPNNHGGYVLVAVYIFLSLVVITVITRLVTRLVNLDDGFIVLAFAFAVANAACIHQAVTFGLGRHISNVSEGDLEVFQRYFYASQIFLILSMASAKIALVLLLDMILRPMPRFKIISRITLAAVAAWSVGAVLAITFECPLPRPWSFATDGCVNLAVLYDSVEAFNIVLEFIIVALATALMLKVQVSAEKRWQIIGLFATRVLVVVVAIGQTISVRETSAATDLTWVVAIPTICTQALVSISTITACIPGMKQTLQDMSSGLTRMVIPDGLQFSSNSLATRGQSTISSTLQRGQRKGKSSAIVDDDETAIWHSTTKNSIRGPRNDEIDKETGGSESMRGLREDAILQTKETVVEFDSGDHEHYSD